jgi:hypothetical protein
MTKAPLLIASLFAAAALPVAVAAMPPAQAWEIGPSIRGRNYSVGMPAQPVAARGGGVAFDFPVEGRGQIDAMITDVGPLAGARQITMRYRIDAARGTRFVADESPDQPATVSLYFQRRGDNWSARGRYASYRWYVPARAVVPLEPGVHTVTVGFDEPWGNVYGVENSQDPAGYRAALEDTARLGVAFGSSGLRSHGVYATGPARFTLLALDIE